MLLQSNHFWAFRLFCFQKVLVPKHEIPGRPQSGRRAQCKKPMMCSGDVWSGTDVAYFWASLRGTGLMGKWGSRVLALTHKPRGEATGSCPALEDTCSPRQSTARATHLKENTLGIGHLGQPTWRSRVQTGSSKSGDNTHNPSPGWYCSLGTRGSLVTGRARPPGASPAGACGRGASAQPWPAAVGRACCQRWRSQAHWSRSASQQAVPPNHAPPSRCDWTAAARWWTCGDRRCGHCKLAAHGERHVTWYHGCQQSSSFMLRQPI